MAIQYSKVVCSILLSLLAVILFLRNRREERKLCMVAMILSGIGDIFMTDVLKLGIVVSYLEIPKIKSPHISVKKSEKADE